MGKDMSPWTVMMSIVLILTPVICWGFTLNAPENRTPLRKIVDVIHKQRYYLHAEGYLIIIEWKGITDDLNEPIKVITGHWTSHIHSFEGEIVLFIQDTFANPAFTAFLNFHYLFIYLFLIYVTTVFYAYTGERFMRQGNNELLTHLCSCSSLLSVFQCRGHIIMDCWNGFAIVS